MTPTSKARTIKSLLDTAAEVAADMSAQLTEAADTRGSPKEINSMVGAVLGIDDHLEHLAHIIAAIKSTNRARVTE